jgi:glycosyltransferase involved in cell wall biosynthesis
MEAMALRRPIISTFVAGIPELVHPGEHGWLVPAGDAEALVEAIVECLATGAEELGRMGQAARLRVQHRHNAYQEAARLYQLFQNGMHAPLRPNP